MFLRTLFVAVPLLLVPAAAHAQSITIASSTSLARVDARGAAVAKRPLTQSPEGVSRSDCDADQKIRFPLLVSGFQANATLSAWASVAGVDCAQSTNRANGLCTALELALPLTPTLEVDVPVRRLVASASADADARACGKLDLTSVEVQFLYFGPGTDALPAAKASTVIEVDTIGPAAPTQLHVRPGNGRILLSWDALEGVASVAGVTGYCDASPSSALRAGIVPTPELDAKLGCGALAGPGTSMTLSGKADAPLPNEELAVIAVSMTDSFGNRGPLSAPVTATPSASADPDASEGGGGGGCATTRTRSPFGAAALLVLGAIVALARRRRS